MAKLFCGLRAKRIRCQLSNGKQLQVSHSAESVLHGVLMTLVAAGWRAGDARTGSSVLAFIKDEETYGNTFDTCVWGANESNQVPKISRKQKHGGRDDSSMS